MKNAKKINPNKFAIALSSYNMVEMNFNAIIAEELHINQAAWVQWLLQHMFILWRARGNGKFGNSKLSSEWVLVNKKRGVIYIIQFYSYIEPKIWIKLTVTASFVITSGKMNITSSYHDDKMNIRVTSLTKQSRHGNYWFDVTSSALLIPYKYNYKKFITDYH